MSRKCIIIGGATAALCLLIGVVVFSKRPSQIYQPIIDPKRTITQTDYWRFIGRDDHKNASSSPKTGDSLIDNETLYLFRTIQQECRDMQPARQLQAVRARLIERVKPGDRAERLFLLYRRFTDYQKERMLKQNEFLDHQTFIEMLKNLQDLHDFRRGFFGREVADDLFGSEVKSSEYSIRRQIILNNSTIRSDEKLRLLNELRMGMWAAEADTIDSRQTPMENYRDEITLFRFDLNTMNPMMRSEKLRQIRRRYFSPVDIELMEKAEANLPFYY